MCFSLSRNNRLWFFIRFPSTNAWLCHSLCAAFWSSVVAWGRCACSLFLSFCLHAVVSIYSAWRHLSGKHCRKCCSNVQISDLWEPLRIWKDSRLWKIVILCILSLWEKFLELSSKNCRLCDFKCHGYIVHPTNLGWPVYDSLCISQQNHSSRYVQKRKERAV